MRNFFNSFKNYSIKNIRFDVESMFYFLLFQLIMIELCGYKLSKYNLNYTIFLPHLSWSVSTHQNSGFIVGSYLKYSKKYIFILLLNLKSKFIFLACNISSTFTTIKIFSSCLKLPTIKKGMRTVDSVYIGRLVFRFNCTRLR